LIKGITNEPADIVRRLFAVCTPSLGIIER